LAGAKTVVWNGPMGVFEFPKFAQGTFAIAEMLGGLKHATTIIGGGDSAAAIRDAGLEGCHVARQHRRRRQPGVPGRASNCQAWRR
jgi:3-phosphoglycerate kinase